MSCESRQALGPSVSPDASQLTCAWSKSETHIALGQQARAELHVVLQVERSHGLKPHAEGREIRRLGKLLHTPDAAKLLLRVLGDG